jgi:hypothetical protein
MKWTRRKFLEASTTGPVLAPFAAGLVTAIEAAPTDALNEDERSALRVAMDKIIPAGDGMPSASDAGGIEYLDRVMRQEPEVASAIRDLLAELNVHRTLNEFEAKAPKDFARLRDFVYESYYTRPRIWKLLGYENYPTDHKGPHLAPFDETILAEVRSKPKFYREA